jgi:hypothetical protein
MCCRSGKRENSRHRRVRARAPQPRGIARHAPAQHRKNSAEARTRPRSRMPAAPRRRSNARPPHALRGRSRARWCRGCVPSPFSAAALRRRLTPALSRPLRCAAGCHCAYKGAPAATTAREVCTARAAAFSTGSRWVLGVDAPGPQPPAALRRRLPRRVQGGGRRQRGPGRCTARAAAFSTGSRWVLGVDRGAVRAASHGRRHPSQPSAARCFAPQAAPARECQGGLWCGVSSSCHRLSQRLRCAAGSL